MSICNEMLQASRAMPDAPSSTTTSSTIAGPCSTTPRAAAPRPPRAAEPTSSDAPRSSAERPRSTAGRGVFSYFTAGANASAGRDPGVGPLRKSYAGPCSLANSDVL